MWPYNMGLGFNQTLSALEQQRRMTTIYPSNFPSSVAVAQTNRERDALALERMYEMKKDPERMKAALVSLKTEHDDSKKRANQTLKVFKMFEEKSIRDGLIELGWTPPIKQKEG